MAVRKKFIVEQFTISYEKVNIRWNMPYTHYHHDYEIYILESGERSVTIDDNKYLVSTHDATLFSSNVPHTSKGNSPFSGICIHFSEQYLDRYFTSDAKIQLMQCFDRSVIHINDIDFHNINQLAQTFSPNYVNNFVYLADILNILNLSDMPIQETAFKSDVNQTKSEQILSYVNDNYTSIKSIEEIASLFNISERYIFRIFKKTCNTTPKTYINQLRIEHACHRLNYSDKTIKYISYDCGFDNYEYFIRIFKKVKGCTPTEYRRQ